MAHPENDKTPEQYAASHLEALEVRWGSELGQWVRAYAPRAWPGVPPEALVGFTTIGLRRADTGDPPVSNSFREIGYFQTEAGPRTGPSPHPDPQAPANNWGRLARDPRVVALLGRPATMAPGGWREAVADQTAVGLYNLRDAADRVAAGLPAAVRPTRPGSLWNAALGFTGFSAGVGGARSAVAPYAAALARVPEDARFGAWVDLLARAGTAARLGPAGSHGNPAYSALRTYQKLASGRALARRTGGEVGWFDPGFGAGEPVAQEGLRDAAYARPTRGVWAAPTGARGAGGWLGPLAASLAAAGAAWWGLTRTRAGRRLVRRLEGGRR